EPSRTAPLRDHMAACRARNQTLMRTAPACRIAMPRRRGAAMNDMQPFDILVVGGANTDYMVRGPKLPGPGDAVEGEDFHTAPGGKGLNQAAAAARLGAH